jgi:hypothetical protein
MSQSKDAEPRSSDGHIERVKNTTPIFYVIVYYWWAP